ncbi:MAG TPA: alpha-amylase family glycosyl hydrolase [Acidimicrobiia bacterium]|nr:alpha-amylase family glycosyl hydrolase [Acidimicrobiia bacterium]
MWAPRARGVAVRSAGIDHELAPEGARRGVFAATLPIAAGDDYELVLDGGRALPDPCSRWQPAGVEGPSRVLDTTAFGWSDDDWPGVALPDLVVYELHVGTFTGRGTFDAAVGELDDLVRLGVSAIEVMPISTFPGNRGWGYDGLYTSAPHPAYGGPHGFARLVDAAHALGLGVILDVVYNHVGPGSEALAAFGPYFTDRHHTFWGDAIDYSVDAVREWAIQNAEMWVGDYHVDGLRLDATHAVFDDCRPHVLAELADRVRTIDQRALVIAEMQTGDLRPLEQWGLDAQWADELHHAVHVLLTGERDGYYEHYGRVGDVAHELERPEGRRLVVCAQNHDQIGNRAYGDRLTGAKLRVAALCSILSRGTPLLFMGEEYDEHRPFTFFTDHIDPAIARATREGRRREFARFAAFAGDDLPDPQDPATFAAAKLDRAGADREHRRYYEALLRLRRLLPDAPFETEVDEDRRVLRARRGDVRVVVNFSDRRADGVPPWSGVVDWPGHEVETETVNRMARTGVMDGDELAG